MTKNFKISNIEDWNSVLEDSKNGNSDAMNEVAMYYRDGLTLNDVEIVKPDPKQAFEWTRKSYESGDIKGMVNYADYLSDGEYLYCEKNIQLAMKLYEEAIEKGSTTAIHNLALEFRNKQNFQKAFELYQKSNRSSEFYPELTLGLCYYYGIGVVKNKIKAFEIFKTIEKGKHNNYEVDEANYLIGKIYLEGEVVEQSIEKARYYLELADTDGDHRSAQELLILIGRTKFIN